MSMRELLLATGNAHKAAELAAVLEGVPLMLKTLRDYPHIKEPEEPWETLEENARAKASYYAEVGGLCALADDSGLEVDSLEGRPGVRSARYAGPGAGAEANNAKLLGELAGRGPELRTARFRCVLALAVPGRLLAVESGEVEGRIADAGHGGGGFGYDPIFFLPGLGRTMAELSAQEKNRISHRARALARMRPHLVKLALEGPDAFSASAK